MRDKTRQLQECEITMDEFERYVYNLLMEKMPKKKKPRSKTTGIRVRGDGSTYIREDMADIDIYLPEDAGYNEAVEEMVSAINELIVAINRFEVHNK